MSGVACRPAMNSGPRPAILDVEKLSVSFYSCAARGGLHARERQAIQCGSRVQLEVRIRIKGALVLAALACLNPATSQQQAHEFRVRISVNLVQVDATRH
ncbi:MAG: hypothetical protein DMG57_07755 [Acidobacteria bacterium]|nr:MAG: hypothetical protein DMG57_07755 [Acidobacteriota bacterium]